MADVKALIDAVTLGDRATVQAVLAADPSLVQQVDAQGATALHHAAFMGRHDIVGQT
jgi:ankyrin repeat protein